MEINPVRVTRGSLRRNSAVAGPVGQSCSWRNEVPPRDDVNGLAGPMRDDVVVRDVAGERCSQRSNSGGTATRRHQSN